MMNAYLKSFLLGLSGVIATYCLQFFASTDFGPLWTPLIAAGVPVLINYTHKGVQTWLTAAALLCCLALAVPAQAGDQFRLTVAMESEAIPDLSFKVAGPSQVQVGRRVRLYVDFDNEAAASADVAIEYECLRQSDPDAVLQIDQRNGGREAFVWADPGVYQIRVTVTQLTNARNKVRADHTLEVDGQRLPPLPQPKPTPPTPKPVPVPDPVPTPPQPVPNPDPTFPAGEFGMAEATYRIVLQVPSTNRKAEAACLASKIASLINDLKTGKVASAQGVINAIGSAFDSCLSPGWDTARVAFTDRVSSIYSAGQLSNLAKWQTLVNESLEGLNAAAR